MSIVKNTYSRMLTQKWELGFVQNRLEDIIRGEPLSVRWVKKPYRDRWFADPFILDVTDEYISLLVEEYSYALKRGRIARLLIDKKSLRIDDMKIVLDLPTHLSFPAIKRKGNDIYIYPENSASSELKIYQYDPISEICNPLQTLIARPLTDATLLEINDVTFLLATELPHPNGTELSIFKKDTTTNAFVHAQTISFHENIARNAGMCFVCNGKIYRPAQESNNNVYGHSIVIQELVVNGDGALQLNEVSRITSPHKQCTLGMHTLNMYKGQIVIDVHGFRHYRTATLLHSLAQLFK